MTSDARPSDPRASLAATAVAVSRATDLDAALGAILGAIDASMHPLMGAVLVQDPDRSGLVVAASSRMDADADARLTAAVADPTHPFAEAANARVATFDRESTLPTGTAYVGAYLPLLSATGGAEVSLGSIGFGWLAPRVTGCRRARRPRRLRRAGDARGRAGAPRIDRRRALRMVRAPRPQRRPHRARERADGRPRARARAGARRPADQRGVAGDLRRRRLPGDQPRGRACRRRRRPAPGRGRAGRVGPAGRHGRADRRRRVRADRAGLGRR